MVGPGSGETTIAWERKRRWDNPQTASTYHDFALHYGLYDELGKSLVAFADIRPGMTVVELACGTGVTTKRILERLQGNGRVYAIDYSPTMLHYAETDTDGPVEFVLSTAENVANRVDGPVDRVLCSSAFWQIDRPAVLSAVRSLLTKNGVFVFNNPVGGNPVLGALLKKMAELSPDTFTTQRFKTTLPENIEAALRENHFKTIDHRGIYLNATPDEARAFLHIDSMTEQYFPSLSYEKRLELTDQAYELMDRRIKEKSKWELYKTKPA